MEKEFLGKDKIMDEQKVKRINELYRKSKAEGLTDAEKKEQKIDVEEKDGTIVNLGEKFGNKAGH